MSDLLDALRDAIGAPHVLTEDLTAYERDWRGRAQGKALAVVRPGSTDEVAQVVRLCAKAKAAGARVSIVPQGGNTGLVLGSTPDDTGEQIVLSLQRMNRIRRIDADNASITVEAGCILQNVQAAAHAAGLLFPLSLAAEGTCTIGGNLATNAGGTQVVRYGNARDLCLGLEVVTAQGDVWQGLKALRKDNTGYDLRHLMIGSEGSLGIITAASLRLFPLPPAQLTAWALVPSMAAAVALLKRTRAHVGAELNGFEVMGHLGLRLVAQHMPQLRIPLWPTAESDGPYAVLIDISARSESQAAERLEALLSEAIDAREASDAAIAKTLAQAREMWHIRESIPLAQAQEGLNIKHDISVPISSIAPFCETALAALQSAVPGVRLVNFGHLGDGNLHFNVHCPQDADSAAFLRTHEAQINEIVYAQVRAYGGSISAEHGIGSLKRDTLPHYQSPVALDLMRRIKRTLDPLGLLNPGRVIQT